MQSLFACKMNELGGNTRRLHAVDHIHTYIHILVFDLHPPLPFQVPNI